MIFQNSKSLSFFQVQGRYEKEKEGNIYCESKVNHYVEIEIGVPNFLFTESQMVQKKYDGE